jgi:hypothetical protein
MEVPYEFWLCFQFVEVVNGVNGGWLVWQILRWWLVDEVSVFGLRMTGNSGTRQRLVSLSNQPLRIDSLDTVTFVLDESYI